MRPPVLPLIAVVLCLTVQMEAQSSCDAGSFSCGNEVTGTIAAGVCPTGCNELAQDHRFNVFANTTLVTLRAASSDTALAIEVLDSEGVSRARVDGIVGSETELNVVLQPAIYTARVIALPAGSVGIYRLDLNCLIGDPGIFCTPSTTTLCLHNRFSARVTVNPDNPSSTVEATAVPDGDLYGFFSLPELTNDRLNPEVFVKILDGRAINGRWWIFFGGLTGFDYEITIRDNFTKREKTYRKSDVSSGDGVDVTFFSDR